MAFTSCCLSFWVLLFRYFIHLLFENHADVNSSFSYHGSGVSTCTGKPQCRVGAAASWRLLHSVGLPLRHLLSSTDLTVTLSRRSPAMYVIFFILQHSLGPCCALMPPLEKLVPPPVVLVVVLVVLVVVLVVLVVVRLYISSSASSSASSISSIVGSSAPVYW